MGQTLAVAHVSLPTPLGSRMVANRVAGPVGTARRAELRRWWRGCRQSAATGSDDPEPLAAKEAGERWTATRPSPTHTASPTGSLGDNARRGRRGRADAARTSGPCRSQPSAACRRAGAARTASASRCAPLRNPVMSSRVTYGLEGYRFESRRPHKIHPGAAGRWLAAGVGLEPDGHGGGPRRGVRRDRLRHRVRRLTSSAARALAELPELDP